MSITGTPDFQPRVVPQAAVVELLHDDAAVLDLGYPFVINDLVDLFEAIVVCFQPVEDDWYLLSCIDSSNPFRQFVTPPVYEVASGYKMLWVPCGNQISGTLNGNIGTNATDTTPTNVWVYGVHAPITFQRFDGRLFAQNSNVAFGTYTASTAILPALTSPERYLISQLTVVPGIVASGTAELAIKTTVMNQPTTLVEVLQGTTPLTPTVMSWPQGLLLDPGSNVTVQPFGTPSPGAFVSITYDTVS